MIREILIELIIFVRKNNLFNFDSVKFRYQLVRIAREVANARRISMDLSTILHFPITRPIREIIFKCWRARQQFIKIENSDYGNGRKLGARRVL